MTFRLFALPAFVLVLAGCDAFGGTPTPHAATEFQAIVSGAATASITGTAQTAYQERGVPGMWLMLTNHDPSQGGISFSRSYDFTLRPGTYAVGMGEALAGGFHAYLTVPVSPDSVVTFWGFEGSLTVDTVADDIASGSFSFRAGPGPGIDTPVAVAEGTFKALITERD